MVRLIPFELGRIWRKRSFLLSVCSLVLLHLFLLWYTSLPDEETPPLSAYKALWEELSGKSEEEKRSYLTRLKERADGICFVQDILAMQGFQNEMGNILAKREMQEHPGVFEAYYPLYQSGAYLEFTPSFAQEQALINEVYEECLKVSGYGAYLRSIQENKETLSGISIFGGQAGDTYSSRNLQRSAADYAGLTDQNIRFAPSKGITSAMQSIWTDLLLVLSVMLFVGSLIAEEKEKKLFYITRGTRYGVLHSIAAKLTALLVHCILLTALFYMVSLIFFGQSTGWIEWSAGLQSVVSYMESSLPVSILGYIILSILTKAFVLFGIGAVLIVFCILSGIIALPFLAGAGIIGGSALLYYLIPAGSIVSMLKYVNPVGLMKTEDLYGGYLNFNLFGYPVSRLVLSFVLAFLICILGTVGSLWLFSRMRSMEGRKLHLPFSVAFRPHTNLLRHEAYKFLVTNKALLILFLFAVLFAYRSLDRTYTPSVKEQYYRDIMAELEGELTDEKEELIAAERARYEEAFQKLGQVDEMTNAGEMSAVIADNLKAQANMILAFYPMFQRVEKQYEHIKQYGGGFIYDTGYLYLSGILEDSFPVDFVMISVGVLLAVSGTAAMEYQSGSLFLIRATKVGRRKIFMYKALICGMAAAVLALVPFLCRIYRIASVYPLHSFGADIRNIPHFAEFVLPLPVLCFLLLLAFSQSITAAVVAWLTILLSVWRKNQAQTIFFALLFLVVPMLLKLLGFEMAKWFSLYPLYGWSGMLG